jgi:hypothetical protein
VRLPQFIGESPEVAEVNHWAMLLGFNSASRWGYLTYGYWGGEIEHVYGVASDIGAINDSETRDE